MNMYEYMYRIATNYSISCIIMLLIKEQPLEMLLLTKVLFIQCAYRLPKFENSSFIKAAILKFEQNVINLR